MSINTRHDRYQATRSDQVRRYLWYAFGEVLLIFAGITLALWFSNWNEERQLRKVELESLSDIAANLQANIEHINANIEEDLMRIDACERVETAMDQPAPWNETLATDVYNCKWWSSPFFTSAAYESLKLRGLELISNNELRAAIVRVYEQTYAFHVNDTDKSFWNFQTAVIEPIWVRYMRRVGPEQYAPNDYGKWLEEPEFRNMLASKVALQRSSVNTQRNTLAETEKVAEMIRAELSARSESG